MPRFAGSSAARVGLTAVAMVVVAEGAVWLLRPPPAVDPAAVSEADFFPTEAIERARDFRRGQLYLGLAGIAAQGGLLIAVALGHPAAARRALEWLGRRPVLGAAAAGAGLSVAVTAASLPVGIWAHERAVDYGLSVQELPSWLADAAKSTAITAGLAAAGGSLLLVLVRRFRRRWWLPGSAAVVGIAAVFVWLAPVVLAPLFNRFEPLPQGDRLRDRVLELAGRAGVDVGEVYRVDASRRVTALNAYVGGLGPTKRVVLFDNLIEEADPSELVSVVAHELAHVEHDDVPRGIAFVGLIAPLGLVFAREIAEGLLRRTDAQPGTPAALPAYVLALGVAAFVLSVPGNRLSREVEASADTFALELTRDPEGMIALQRRLASTNLADPDPPDLVTFLFATHPPTVERIGAAEAFRRNESGRPGNRE